MEMAGITQNLQKWVELLWEYHGDGTTTCGNTAGMEFLAAGNPRGVFAKCATTWFLVLNS